MIKEDDVKETAVELFVDAFFLETSLVYNFKWMFKHVLKEDSTEQVMHFYLDMAYYALRLLRAYCDNEKAKSTKKNARYDND